LLRQEAQMTHYRAYIIGSDGHIARAIDLHCENDDDAKLHARQLVDGHDVELWRGEQRLAMFERKH
jgi:hypothetical protein